MSKVIIVECCRNCPSARLYYFEPFCWIADKKIESGLGIADWCPLPDLPEKMLTWHDDEQDDYEMGWNACLDAITGGKEK